MKKSGRPPKSPHSIDSKQKIIDATIRIIETCGAEAVTVRNVCEKSGVSTGTFYHYFHNKDDLLMYFVREAPLYQDNEITISNNPVNDVTDLYMRLIHLYQDLGINFMKNFYNTANQALSAYMGQTGKEFSSGTIMFLCEKRLELAQKQNHLRTDIDIHTISEDICTIVKGCVFEWCLCDGNMDIKETLHRILQRYFYNILS